MGICNGIDGRFLFRPIVGVDIAEAIEVNASYELISLDGGNWNALTLGILFEFGKQIGSQHKGLEKGAGGTLFFIQHAGFSLQGITRHRTGPPCF